MAYGRAHPAPTPSYPCRFNVSMDCRIRAEQRELSVTHMLTQRIVTSADEVIVVTRDKKVKRPCEPVPDQVLSFIGSGRPLSEFDSLMARDWVHHAAQLS